MYMEWHNSFGTSHMYISNNKILKTIQYYTNNVVYICLVQQRYFLKLFPNIRNGRNKLFNLDDELPTSTIRVVWWSLLASVLISVWFVDWISLAFSKSFDFSRSWVFGDFSVLLLKQIFFEDFVSIGFSQLMHLIRCTGFSDISVGFFTKASNIEFIKTSFIIISKKKFGKKWGLANHLN